MKEKPKITLFIIFVYVVLELFAFALGGVLGLMIEKSRPDELFIVMPMYIIIVVLVIYTSATLIEDEFAYMEDDEDD